MRPDLRRTIRARQVGGRTTRQRRSGRARLAGLIGQVALAGLIALVAVTVAGCASMPTSGPIRAAGTSSGGTVDQLTEIDPAPPSSGQSPAEVAQGFLDAMTASPIRLDVARKFLSPRASAWSPQDATITYRDTAIRPARGGTIVVRLIGADRLDATGSWRGALTREQSRIRLRFSVDATGQYRIDDPPNALIVPEPWFAQRFRSADLYFFDPTGSIVVPQPVFVPRGDQFATSLIDDLLAGPRDRSGTIVRSYLPTGGQVSLSVPVDDGVAQVALTADAARPSAAQLSRMLAQLAWTLGQEPSIRSLQLSINGVDLALPDGAESYSLGNADRFATTGYLASTRLYGVSSGLVRSAAGTDFTPTSGPLGERRHALRSVAVDLTGTSAAAVTRDGGSVLLAPLGTPAPSGDGPSGSGTRSTSRPRTVLSGAVDLLRPAWDHAGRLWLVDRDGGSARVLCVTDGVARAVQVPGVTGRDVTAFTVSRDGTRFVAAVRGPGATSGSGTATATPTATPTDTVRVDRIRTSTQGRVLGVTSGLVVAGSAVDPVRVPFLAWRSPTTLVILTPLLAGKLMEARTVSVDGAPPGLDAIATTIEGRPIGLAGSPDPSLPTYAYNAQGLTDLVDDSTISIGPAPVHALGYAG